MKLIINKLLICLTFFLMAGTIQSVYAQSQSLADQLKDRLEGKDKLDEIMYEVEEFYAPLSDEIKNGGADIPKLKFWNRWAHYWSSRLGPEGEFVNINKLMFEETQRRLQERGTRRAVSGDWEFAGASESTFAGTNGPLNGVGRVDRIAFHPTNANIVYVGTPAGGLWKTTDGGTTWTAMTDYLGSLGIAGIVVDWNNPNNVYILTGDGDSSNPNYFVSIFGYIRKSIGVLKSTNGGVSWSSVGAFPGVTDPYYGYELIQDPLQANVLYAATTQGLFRSANGGASWILSRAGRHYDVAIKPGASIPVYTCDDNSFYWAASPELGVWIPTVYLGGAPQQTGRKAIGVTAHNPAIVYMLCGGGGNPAGQFSGFYRSNSQGAVMTRTTVTPNILGSATDGSDNGQQSIYDHCLAVSPSDSTLIVTGGLTVWRTTNSGTGFSNIQPYWGNPAPAFSVHPDIHALEFNPLDGKLYVCHDGGVNVSSDNGTTFTDLSKGLEVTQFYHLAAPANREYRFAAGAQDNGVKYRPSATTDFQHVTSGDGFSPSFVATRDDKFYITINDVFRRIDMKNNTFGGTNPILQFYKVTAAHPTDSNIVFCGGSSIYKSNNQGNSWSNKGASGSWAIAFTPSDASKMYAAGRGGFGPGTDGKMYRSTNSGESWTDITANPGFPSSFTKITDIAVSPVNSNLVIATFGGFTASAKVALSNDGGNNWGLSNFNLPNIPINCVAITATGFYVGTDNGVYHKTYGSTSWTDISDNMPNVPVTEILIDENTGTMYAATFGRGVWKFPYCVSNMNLTAPLEGVLAYQAATNLTSSSEIPGDPDNDIILKGGATAKLLPGFHAKSGAKVKVFTGACTDNAEPN